MAYRLYRRDQVNKGSWYFAVTCKGCNKPLYVLDDHSSGTRGVPLVGDGDISSPCLRCFHDDTYKVGELFVTQAEEDMQGARPPRVNISSSHRRPLWNTYPKAKVTFGVGYIEDRPAAAAIVARIVTSWADLEVESARLLAEIMGTEIPAAAAVFGALRSSRTQHDALNAAAEVTLDERDLELFQAHLARKASLEKERNDIAHGCYGVSVSIPNDIVWVAQTDYLMFSAGGGNPEEFRRKQFVYELGTLERIAQEIGEFYTQLGFFRGYLWARRDVANGAAFRAQRYIQLCSQPHIRQALDRLQTAKRAAKSRG